MVDIYTDGACKGNPGPGGWAAVLLMDEGPLELKGGEYRTTNNRMEMKAVIEALSNLPAGKTKARVHSDSAYLINCFQQKWYVKWQHNGWRTSSGKDVENQDLWKQLLSMIDKIDVQFLKVKGHSTVVWNNRCDELAREASQAFYRQRN